MSLAGAKVAVTGATGFLGRYLVDALLDRGVEVIAVVRTPAKARGMADRGVDVRRADLAEPAALEEAFAGADAVVSNAALFTLGDQRAEDVIEANVGGTDNVFSAVAAAGIDRVVHVSSAVAYAPRADHFYREDDPLRDDRGPVHRFNAYAVSKGCAERLAWTRAKQHSIALSTLRPHTVFGHGDRGTFTRWFLRFMSPSLVSAFPVGVRFPPVYAGDLAEAVCRMLERPAARNRAYNLASAPDAVSYWDLMEAYRAAGGDTPKLVVPFYFPIRRRYAVDRARDELDFEPRPLVAAFEDMLLRADREPLAAP